MFNIERQSIIIYFTSLSNTDNIYIGTIRNTIINYVSFVSMSSLRSPKKIKKKKKEDRKDLFKLPKPQRLRIQRNPPIRWRSIQFQSQKHATKTGWLDDQSTVAHQSAVISESLTRGWMSPRRRKRRSNLLLKGDTFRSLGLSSRLN